MIKHLTAQILQCFCYPVGESFLLCRQGGLQRFIWPFEALFAMEAISRIGDYDDFRPVLRKRGPKIPNLVGEYLFEDNRAGERLR